MLSPKIIKKTTLHATSNKKIYTNDNLILYSLARLVLNRFAAVGSQYGVTSILQSVASIKGAVWNCFATVI